MAKNEKTSKAMASLASRALKTPEKLTKAEIKKLAASVLTQASDKKKPAAKKSTTKKAVAKKTATKKTAAKKAPAKKKAAPKKKK